MARWIPRWPSSPNSRLIETLFGTGRWGDASTEIKACTGLTRRAVQYALFYRKVHPASPSVCQPCRAMPLIIYLWMPCMHGVHGLSVSTNIAQSCQSHWQIPRKPSSASLASKTLTSGNPTAHDRQPQGLPRRLEPPPCDRPSCSSNCSGRVLPAADYPPDGRHLTQI